MGAKMDDATFSEEEILKHAIVPEDIEKRPNLMPLAIEWPDEFYALDKTPIQIHFDKRSYDFQEVGLALVKPDLASPIQFRLYSTDESPAPSIVDGWVRQAGACCIGQAALRGSSHHSRRSFPRTPVLLPQPRLMPAPVEAPLKIMDCRLIALPRSSLGTSSGTSAPRVG